MSDQPRIASVQPTVPASRRLLSTLPLLLIWGAALWPLLLWLLTAQDPEAAVRVKQVTGGVVLWTGLTAAAVGAVFALLFPPFPAWIRLLLSRLRVSFASDRGPLLKALAELQHFESATRHLEIGRLALSRSDLQLAATHLSRAVELDDTIAGAHHQLGLLLLRVGQVPAAAAAFERAERLDAGHAFGESLLHLGRCALLLGDAPAAARLLEEHRKRHGGSRKSHYWLGKARQATGEDDAAIEAMRYAAAPAERRLTAEENWFRALARVWLWRWGRR